MTDEVVSPFDDNAPDLEGCTSTAHCHRRRSSRQETAFTPTGTIRACHRPSGWGTNHPGIGPCKLHGGNTPNANRSAEAESARKAVQTLGLPVDIGPADALLQEIQRTAGHVAWLGAEIAKLEKDELTWGLYEENIEPDIMNTDSEVITTRVTGRMRADSHVLYKMYRDERKHLATTCKLALDAGVNERIVRMYEQVGDVFVGIIERILDRLQLTDEQRRMVPGIVTAELTALTNGDGNGNPEHA